LAYSLFGDVRSPRHQQLDQIRFGEAIVQLTVYERKTRQIEGIYCIMMEPDIASYKDLAGRFFREVVVNAVTHTITDPK